MGHLKRMNGAVLLTGLLFISLLVPVTAQARVVDEVKFKTLPDGYEIRIDFLLPIRYQSHAPATAAKELYVQLKTVDFSNLTQEEVDSLRERLTWGPDPSTAIPLQEITFEGGDPERPQMTFLFTEEVACDVRSSADMRSLIVSVKTKQPSAAVPLPAVEKPEEKIPPEISFPEKVIPQDQATARLMEEARDTLMKKEYDRSVQLYLKILQTAEGPVKQQAQELLGVARERNNQIAHAKVAYQTYLQEYPTGPDADRVRQRLAGLITAAKPPKEKLRPAKRAVPKQKGWRVLNFGNFSQFYFRDQTTPEGGATRVNRSDLSSDLDFNSRWRSDATDINARFTGGYRRIFEPGSRGEKRLSALSVDMRRRKNGWYGKLGRQSLGTGGVFGRFDGALTSLKLNPALEVNGVFGYVVENVQQIEVQTPRRFYGVNLDFGTFRQRWDFNTYFINQQNAGLTDRTAVGAELRYFDPLKAFFTLLDYDVFFNALNIFLFSGHWTLPTKTTLNLIFDYRKNPFLTLTNALQGQAVGKLSELFGRYTKDELKQLAKDRTANSKTLTFGVTQDLKKDWQLATDITLSEMEGTITSGGVQGQNRTGWDYTLSAQLIGSNVFKENDVVIAGLSYGSTDQYHITTLNFNGTFPMTRKIRLLPKFRLDYRDAKKGSDNRLTTRPSLRVDYNFKKWMHLEAEGGVEWLNEKSSGSTHRSTEFFITLGYRVTF